MEVYAADNDYRMPATYGLDVGGPEGGRYPGEIWFNAMAERAYKGTRVATDISYESFGPYLPGFDRNMNVIDDVWKCPANRSRSYDDVAKRRAQRGYFRMHYSYFGRVDLWKPGIATHPEDIPRKFGSSKTIMFADILYNWMRLMVYNHGKFGYSFEDDLYAEKLENMNKGGRGEDGLPSITGINKVYGDGHAEWKKRGEFDLQQLGDPSLETTQHYIKGHNARVGTFY